MGATTSTGVVELDHPYRPVGIVLVLIALVIIAFDIGVLA